jgi:hypothetical protein
MKLPFKTRPNRPARPSVRATFRLYRLEWQELLLIITVQELRRRRLRVKQIAQILGIEEMFVRCYLRRRGLPYVPGPDDVASIGETRSRGTMILLNEEVTVSAQVVKPTKWESQLNPRLHLLPVIQLTAWRHDSRPRKRRKRAPVAAGPN